MIVVSCDVHQASRRQNSKGELANLVACSSRIPNILFDRHRVHKEASLLENQLESTVVRQIALKSIIVNHS